MNTGEIVKKQGVTRDVDTAAVVRDAKWIALGNAVALSQHDRDAMMAEVLAEALARPEEVGTWTRAMGDCNVEVVRDEGGILHLNETRPVRSTYITEAWVRRIHEKRRSRKVGGDR